jgi:hypothetical protein
MVCILTDLDNLGATLAIGKHLTLVDIVKVKGIALFICKVWMLQVTELTSTCVFKLTDRRVFLDRSFLVFAVHVR